MSHCPHFDGLAVMDGDPDTTMLVARLRCGMWSCESCAVKNRQIWRAHIIDRVNKMGGTWLFLTITAHRNAHKAGKTLLNLKNAWKRLYDRLRYKFKGEKIEYVWLYEMHKREALPGKKASRSYHIHAIVRARVDGENVWSKKAEYWYHPEMHAWLKNSASEVGAGFMCHCAKINDGNGGLVSAYITKYMTKDAQNLIMPKHQRRIQTSRGFGSPKPPKTPGINWEFRAHLLRGDVRRHVKTVDVSTGEVVTLKHFETNELYPGENSKV